MRFRRFALGLSALAVAFAFVPARAAEPTTIAVTDEVLVSDVERLGVHFSWDNFYDSVILKQRVAENFEGTIHRLHVMGDNDQPDPYGIYLWGKDCDESWVGATAHVLGGPDQWKQVKVVAVEEREFGFSGDKPPQVVSFVRFDQPVRWSKEGYVAGVLLDRTDLTEGSNPWMERTWRDGGPVTQLNPRFHTPETATVVTGDAPPEVGGNASFELDGTDEESFLQLRVQFYKAAPFDGDWTVRFWARAASGNPELVVKTSGRGTSLTPALAAEWTAYEGTLAVEKPPDVPGNNPFLWLEFHATGGAVRIDNVYFVKDGDGTNPTPFRDELVDVFRDLKPGSVRYLRNVKDSYRNSLLPRILNASHGPAGRDRDRFGTHEFYQFCKYIGADPWATLPGTLLLEEMDQVMEYHGAPADVGLGRLRAELGQEKPWTEVFHKIHIQFGNEAITFKGTGYWGPDYWQSLLERAKSSPYYDPDVFVFHVNEQGAGRLLLDMHPDFDRFTISGYHIFGLYADQIERAGDLPGFYDWVFASAWHMWTNPEHNTTYPNLVAAGDKAKEISIYEGGNYHTTFSTPGETPLDQINRMIVGRAGGMSATHTMLILLKHWGARTQQSFNLSQFNFSPGGAFGNIDGRVRCWGGVLNIGDAAARRFRPRFLALRIANEIIGGDLVRTVHSGADPKFSVTNRFGTGYSPSRDPKEMTVSGIPRIHSYAFREGDRRGLILVSNDPREAQPIVLEFEGGARNGQAEMWWLASDGLESTNEPDWAPDRPEVTIGNRTLDGFGSGYALDLPPATILALEWQQD